jgi:hypothetical protein
LIVILLLFEVLNEWIVKKMVVLGWIDSSNWYCCKQNTQDAVDNFIIASSRAANQNLIPLFSEWRWPISQRVKDELTSLPVSINEQSTDGYPFPNPAPTNGYITLPNQSLEKVTLINSSGKIYVINKASDHVYSLKNLPVGTYYFVHDFIQNEMIPFIVK